MVVFSEIGAPDTVARTVLRDFYSSSLTSKLSHLHGCVGHDKIYFCLSFPEPTEVPFLRRCFPRECSVIAKRSHRNGLKGWCQQEWSAFFLHVSPLSLAGILTELPQLASKNMILKNTEKLRPWGEILKFVFVKFCVSKRSIFRTIRRFSF